MTIHFGSQITQFQSSQLDHFYTNKRVTWEQIDYLKSCMNHYTFVSNITKKYPERWSFNLNRAKWQLWDIGLFVSLIQYDKRNYNNFIIQSILHSSSWEAVKTLLSNLALDIWSQNWSLYLKNLIYILQIKEQYKINK